MPLRPPAYESLRAMSIHVVLCDDETQTARMISWRLMRAGFEVHTAHDGEAAWDITRRVHPDLLITDLQFPGIELVCRVRGTPETAQVPIILLTSTELTPEMQQRMRHELSLSAILPKPCSLRDLVRVAYQATQQRVEPLCTA